MKEKTQADLFTSGIEVEIAIISFNRHAGRAHRSSSGLGDLCAALPVLLKELARASLD